MHTSLENIQILIIDDNPSLVNIFAKVLKIKGFSVTAETTFKKGLRRLQKNKFQIAFVDAPLDGYDEKQILTILHENKIFTKTSVFLFSSTEFNASELDFWKNHGLYSYLKKPIKRSQIIQELENVRINLDSFEHETPVDQPEDEEPTSEQLEKLSQLEKQIHALKTTEQSLEKQQPPKIDVSTEPTPEVSVESTEDKESTSLTNIIDNLKSAQPQDAFITTSKNSPKTIDEKHIVYKEIQQTLSELSDLKKEVQLLEITENRDSVVTSSTPTKRKLKKKSTTPTKRKLKKKSYSDSKR